MSSRPPLLVLVGPTAVGKTAVSLELATALGAEIVSADSRLVYRGMDIGTAKPGVEERERVPHHLIDVVDPSDTFSLARYRKQALTAIDQIHRKGGVPLLVGGTGQYVRAVIEGWVPPPKAEDAGFRRQLEAWAEKHGHVALHRRLQSVDPDRAAAIDARNVRRVIRALEIFEITGVPPSKLKVKQPPPYRILQLGLKLPRRDLYQRIDQRIDEMLALGWLQEIEALMAAGVPASTPAFSAIGYRQLIEYMRGETTLAQAVAEIKRLSRQFVRRQANWFKEEDPAIHWFHSKPGVAEEMAAFIWDWLKGH